MRRIEDFMNRLTDIDWGWWPALSLRPAKDRDINNRVLLKMSSVFGSMTGLLLLFIRLVQGRAEFSFTNVVGYLAFGWVLFFIIYKVTFAYFWNRRARRIRSARARDKGFASNKYYPLFPDDPEPARTVRVRVLSVNDSHTTVRTLDLPMQSWELITSRVPEGWAAGLEVTMTFTPMELEYLKGKREL